MSDATKALIVAVVAALPSSSPRASPLTFTYLLLPRFPTTITVPSPTLLPYYPTYLEAPLGYRAAMIRLGVASPSTHNLSEIPSPPLLLPSTTHKYDILEADIPLRKRARFTTSTGRFEVGESSTAVAAARQPGLDIDIVDVALRHPMSREVGYGITNVWDDMDRYSRQAWSQAMDYNRVVHAELLAYRAEVRALHEQINVLRRQR
ncbi:hypothetical protein Tco_1500602 [Tanacetum coccineum]